MRSPSSFEFDAVIVGGTPAGIMTGITVAKSGRRAVILERTSYIGGLPANGLGATDIHTRGATGGLFLAFVRRIRKHYSDTCASRFAAVAIAATVYLASPMSRNVLHEMYH